MKEEVEMVEREEGMLRDLAEKRRRGQITAREAYNEVYRRGLQHNNYSSPITGLVMFAGGVLCYLSLFAKIPQLPFFHALSQLPTIVFPPVTKYLAIIPFVLSIVGLVHTTYLRGRKGGTGWKGESETVILVREGPYKIVRHPAALSTASLFTLSTVILSSHIPFNILSVTGNTLFWLSSYYSCLEGDKLNVAKWGEEYRQYMEEVPRFNLIKGLWRGIQQYCKVGETKYNEEGEVRDLVEKLRNGELTKDEILKEMRKRGLFHHADEPIPGMLSIIYITVWGVLCFLPVICEIFNWDIPRIPSIEVPWEIACLVFLFSIIMAPPLLYSAYLREKRSITGDENITLVKEGAYGIVRHPAALGGLILLLTLPVTLTCSPFNVPFTILSFFGDAIVLIVFLGCRHEEKVNLRKWGDEYRQYMKEVPAFNFILGIWRWAKRNRKQKKHPTNSQSKLTLQNQNPHKKQ